MESCLSPKRKKREYCESKLKVEHPRKLCKQLKNKAILPLYPIPKGEERTSLSELWLGLAHWEQERSSPLASPEFMYLISVSLYLLTTWYTMCFSFVYLFCKNVYSGPLPNFNHTSNNSSSSIFYCRVIYCCNVLWTLIAHQMCGLEIFSLNMEVAFLFFFIFTFAVTEIF